MEHSLIRLLPVGLSEPLPEGWDASQPGFLMEIVPNVEDPATLGAIVTEIEPDVIVMDADSPQGDAFEWTRAALDAQPGLAIILISRDASPETERLAMRAGAEEILSKQLDGAQINAAIVEVASHRTLRTVQLTPVTDSAILSPDANRLAMNGRIIGVAAGKGGLGKTTIAANLALLAAKAQKSAALIGLDTGDGAILLNLQTRLGLIDLAAGSAENTSYSDEWIKQFSTRHKSGLHYWTWNGNATQATEEPPENFFEMLFAAMRDSFAITIIDFPTLSPEEAASILPLLDAIVVVSSTSDLLAVRSTKTFLDIVDSHAPAGVFVVINRADAGDMITREDFELTLGRTVNGVVTNQPALTAEAINMGAPVVLMQPQSDIAANLRDLAHTVLGISVQGVAEPKKKLFGLFG